MPAPRVSKQIQSKNSLPVGPLERIWREATRPFRLRTWRKLAGISNPHPVRKKPIAQSPNAPAVEAWRLPFPSMVTRHEASFFARCAASRVHQQGRIVDLGCWMGSTAVALAHGVHEAGGTDRIFAVDIFLWSSWMNASHAKLVHGIYAPGESFLPEARRIARDHGFGLVDLVAADLTTFEWSQGPIKILLVDAMKSSALMKQIARSFFPSLQPDGILLHQDFKHSFTSWIHILQYRLRRHFRFIESVPKAGTVGYEVLSTPDVSEVVAATEMDPVSNAEADACFEYSLSLLPEAHHNEVARAHITHYLRHNNQPEEADRVTALYAKRGIDNPVMPVSPEPTATTARAA